MMVVARVPLAFLTSSVPEKFSQNFEHLIVRADRR
jgi:hypothetical protein